MATTSAVPVRAPTKDPSDRVEGTLARPDAPDDGRYYLQVHPVARLINLEVGFSMIVPDPDRPGTLKETVRKPDMGVIRNDNAELARLRGDAP